MRKIRKPLVVMTPKSLLRHPQAISSLEELATKPFEKVIADSRRPTRARSRGSCCARARSTSSCSTHATKRNSTTSPSAARAAVPLTRRRAQSASGALQRRLRARVGPRRAREHGRLGLCGSCAASLDASDSTASFASSRRAPPRARKPAIPMNRIYSCAKRWVWRNKGNQGPKRR